MDPQACWENCSGVTPRIAPSIEFHNAQVVSREMPLQELNGFIALRESCSGFREFGDGPNTVLESTVSNTELSESLPHQVPGTDTEFLSAFHLCAKTNSPSLFAELTEFAAELSAFSSPKQYSRNSILRVS